MYLILAASNSVKSQVGSVARQLSPQPDNAAIVADLEATSVEPEIPPLAFDRPIDEGVDPFTDIFAQLGDLALRMPDRPIACTKSSTPRIETLPIQASWMTGLAPSPRSHMFRKRPTSEPVTGILAACCRVSEELKP